MREKLLNGKLNHPTSMTRRVRSRPTRKLPRTNPIARLVSLPPTSSTSLFHGTGMPLVLERVIITTLGALRRRLSEALPLHLTLTCSGSKRKPLTSSKLRHLLAGSEMCIPESASLEVLLQRNLACLPKYRWMVYNLSPSFNWSHHGFSGA